MIIAIPYDNGEIYEHFGHCDYFALYEFDVGTGLVTSKVLADTSAYHGHQEMADFLRDKEVDAVICGNMGDEARAAVLRYGIVPFPGYCGHADTAADLLACGQLPMYGDDAGRCGGGCGGCGGGCCHDDGEDCGCGGHEDGGCGCGCH